MDKSDKEKAVLELWKSRIEMELHNVTTSFYTRVGIFGAIILFIFQVPFVKNRILSVLSIFGINLIFIKWVLFFMLPIIFVLLLHYNTLDNRYFRDIYMDLIDSVNNGTILRFKPRKRTELEKNRRYERRHDF